MSDKRPHSAISRHTVDSLVALSAGIILLVGQCRLIIPEFMGGLAGNLPAIILLPAGAVLFIVSLALYATMVFERVDWKSRTILVVGALTVFTLGYLYFRANLFFQLPLFFLLAFALLTFAFSHPLGNAQGEFLLAFSVFVNLLTGILFLFSDRLPTTATAAIPLSNSGMGLFFIGASFIGPTALLFREARWRRILPRLGAVPWLAWMYFLLRGNTLVEFLPAACFASFILLSDFIPWRRLKLPDSDVLGRRLLGFMAVIQTVFLISFTSLLNPVEETGAGAKRVLVLLLLVMTECLLGYAVSSLVVTINKLTHTNESAEETSALPEKDENLSNWEKRIARLIHPFTSTQLDRENQYGLLAQQMTSLGKQLEGEKRRSAQLILLSEFSQQLEAQLDAPVSAQLAVNTLHRSINCSFAALYLNDPERRELVVLAVAGTRVSILPPGYRQPINTGVLGRAIRQRKTQVVTDSRNDTDYYGVAGEDTLSLVIVPLIDHGHMKGVIEISDSRPNAFNSHDVQIAEAVAQELLRAWERSEYHQRLTELIQAGISLTTQPDPQAAVQEVANIARQTLRARFTFVTLLDQEGNFTRIGHAGTAPRLLRSISQQANRETLIQSALNAERPFRIRDIRKYKRASRLEIDFARLRSLIAIPIRMHGLSVGAMLAFGKQGEVFFTESDESLASLLSSQASAAIESAWLSHELRTSFATIKQMYQLSFHVIQAEQLKDAATYIADAALNLSNAEATGIVLLAPDKQVEAEVQLDQNGDSILPQHPMELIHRVIESQQSIILSTGQEHENICFPLKTHLRTYGALWLTVPSQQSARIITNLQTLVNQAGVALERLILLVESRQQAKTIEAAYEELENAYDHTLAALMSSLDARDRETEGHSLRVSIIARLLGEAMQVPAHQRKSLERGSLLHDIGKIGISDTILHKPGPLSENEWKIMRQHPDIGARIVEGIPFLQDTLPIIRYHQERWDGSGYPIGLSGKDIPLLARIFAVADAFDALTSDRPYRNRISNEEALEYLKANAGVLFDPEIVSVLVELDSKGLIAGLVQE